MKIRVPRLLYIVILRGLLCNPTYAQSNLPVVVSPAPEAASLGKFADIPVSLYNGIPEINIPIYNIQVNGKSIPISLSYHAGGIKVAEIPSSTGSGWALNAGGVITRTVRGQDDATGDGFRVAPAIPIGSGCLNGASAQDYLIEAALGHNDTEPDMFYYNFNGRVGKFVIDKSGQVHQIPYSNLKIVPTTPGFAGWKVTTEDGVEYDFNAEETLAYSQVPTPGGNASFSSQSYMSSWYLSQIKYPNSSQTVSFEYTTDRITYDIPLSEQRYEYSQASSGSGSVGCNLILDVNQSISAHNSLDAYRLTKIDFPNGSLDFIPGNYRKDYMNGRTLGQININNSNGLVKSFRFQYQYLTATLPNLIPDDGTATATTPANTGLRLHLTSVQEYGSDGITQKGPYLFAYNTSALLPDRVLSKALDHWGYYNGHDENTTLIPSHVFYNGGTYIGGVRDPSSQYAQANILKQITYPTGGTTQFTFESNQANTTAIPSGVPQTQQVTYQIGHCYLTTGASGNFTVNDVNGSVNFSVSLSAAGTNPTATGQDPYTLTARSCPTNTTGSIPSSVFNYIYFQILNVTDPSNPTVVFNQNGSQLFLQGSGQATVTSVVLPNGNYKLKGIKGNSDFSVNAPEITDYDGNFDPEMVFRLKGTTFSASSGTGAATIGGVRIKQMTDYDPVSQKSITKTYDYTNNGQSSGVINWFPYYYYPYNEDDYGCDNAHGTYYYNIYSSTSVLPLTEMQGGNVGYNKVTVSYLDSQNQPGMNGQTEYDYTSAQDYYFAPFYQATSFNPVNVNVCFVNKGSTSSFLFKYPYAPAVCPEWAKGLLTNQIDYQRNADGSYSKVREIHNTYKTDYLGATYDYNINQDVIAAKIAISTHMKNNVVDGNHDTYAIQYYYIPSRFSKLIETDETLYSSSQPITTVKTFAYESLSNLQPTSSTITDSKGDIYTSAYKYPTDFPLDPVYSSMITKNIINPLIQQDNYKNSSFFLNEQKTNYKVWPNNVIAPASVQTTQLSNPADLRLQYYSYDGDGNMLEVSKTNGLHYTYIWDYNRVYPIAEVKNATQSDIAYTSFEADGTGNWTVPSTARDATAAITGSQSYNLSNGAIVASGLVIGGSYMVTYWSRNGSYSINASGGTSSVRTGRTVAIGGSNWTYYEHTVNVTGNSITLTGSGPIDELRLYPVGAQMTTYTYQPLVGMTSVCDLGNRITYYEYDGLQRLKRIRDQDYNIIKSIDYQYQGNSGCGANCYILTMQTLAGTNTLGYPVGVFNVHGKLLGNAAGPSQYVTLWNADTADSHIGTLSAGGDSLHFNLALNSGKTLPSGVTGCRYYQADLAYNQYDGLRNSNAAYVDFGDGTGITLPSDPPAVASLPANTTYGTAYSGEENANTTYYMHTYPDTTLKTITFYHNDDGINDHLDNFNNPATSLMKLKQFRGNLPQNLNIFGGSCYQQPSMNTIDSIYNWSSLHNITYIHWLSGDGANPCKNMAYAQDFMQNNKGLQRIVTSFGYYRNGYRDTTFKISRLKSDWNTYFTELQSLVINEDHWSHEDLTALKKLNSFTIVATTQNHQDDASSPLVPISPGVLDNILNQIAAGAGQTVSNGTIVLLAGGSTPTDMHSSAIESLLSKGWTINLNGTILTP